MPQTTRIVQGGDGFEYNDRPFLFPLIATSVGAGVSGTTAVAAKTAAYTITANEWGRAFSNTGAAGSVTFTLPTPKPGCYLLLFKMAAQNVVASCPANVTINTASTLTNSSAEAGKAALLIIAVSTTQYIAIPLGTWA